MLAAVVVFLVRLYQLLLSPLLHALTGSGCRFYPSCSEYAIQVLRKDGLRRGAPRALRRIGRCHPFHPGGVDLP